jgi:hypothetical protein
MIGVQRGHHFIVGALNLKATPVAHAHNAHTVRPCSEHHRYIFRVDGDVQFLHTFMFLIIVTKAFNTRYASEFDEHVILLSSSKLHKGNYLVLKKKKQGFFLNQKEHTLKGNPPAVMDQVNVGMRLQAGATSTQLPARLKGITGVPLAKAATNGPLGTARTLRPCTSVATLQPVSAKQAK